jgi:FKBP-type peptidyl-prolyl cis-trans isomerase (trigger factor)
MNNNNKTDSVKSAIENIKVVKLDKSRVEITASITAEYFSTFKSKALKNINNEIAIDGFRKGNVPENILVTKVGDMAIMEEMAELALSKVYPEIIINEKIDAIGTPEISILKIARDNPLEFKIVTTVIPEIKIGDYKNIAKKEMIKLEEKIEVAEKEIEDAITKITQSHSDHTGHDHESAEFKEKVKQAIFEEKKIRAQEKKRIVISDEIIEATNAEIPELLVDSETRRIEAQFTDDVKRMGVTIEDYLKHAKKTIEDLRKEWRPHAEKKAKLQLILNEIFKIEKLNVDPKEIENEVKHILAHYKDANHDLAYTYAETVLTNEKVYNFLESQKDTI